MSNSVIRPAEEHTTVILPHKSECGPFRILFLASESVIITRNYFHWEERETDVPVWTAGMPYEGCVKRILQTGEMMYNVGELKAEVRNGCLHVRMPAWSATLYAFRKNH